MIKLFVTDLDGCISYPFNSPKWEAIQEIRKLNVSSRTNHIVPPLSICTGRPHPYAEAVAQWLDIRLPFVFECAGLYHWDGNRIETALSSHDGALDPIHEMKEWLKTDILTQFPTAYLEFAKMMDAGIVAAEAEVIQQAYPMIREKVERDYPDLEVHTTDVSVNVLMPGNNKLQGMKLLAGSLDITLDEIAYIGDTGGDIKALEHVKMPFSPKNATRGVKNVSTNLETETTDAVLEAYHRIITYNSGLKD
jgi:hydroxymethylpyrimidine pyrophosphatase-like HAD family hydrolase